VVDEIGNCPPGTVLYVGIKIAFGSVGQAGAVLSDGRNEVHRRIVHSPQFTAYAEPSERAAPDSPDLSG
jgi:hypothetical protein